MISLYRLQMLSRYLLSRPLFRLKSTAKRMVEEDLRSEPVEFLSDTGKTISLNAVFQDSLPPCAPIGTVVSLHGAPGSHRDFKYLAPLLREKGIRHIGINYPGYGFTPAHDDAILNPSRDSFTHAVLSAACVSGPVVFVGHSRGSENALRMAADAKCLDVVGLLQVNPTGLRRHKGIKPEWLITSLRWLWDLGPLAQTILEPVYLWMYLNILKFKISDGRKCALCIKVMERCDLEKQAPAVERVIENGKICAVVALAGKDHLVEREIADEYAKIFIGVRQMTVSTKEEDTHAVREKVASCLRSGSRFVSVEFSRDGHFLQRDRPAFLVDACHHMLQSKL